jgi:hypothetical protein
MRAIENVIQFRDSRNIFPLCYSRIAHLHSSRHRFDAGGKSADYGVCSRNNIPAKFCLPMVFECARQQESLYSKAGIIPADRAKVFEHPPFVRHSKEKISKPERIDIDCCVHNPALRTNIRRFAQHRCLAGTHATGNNQQRFRKPSFGQPTTPGCRFYSSPPIAPKRCALPAPGVGVIPHQPLPSERSCTSAQPPSAISASSPARSPPFHSQLRGQNWRGHAAHTMFVRAPAVGGSQRILRPCLCRPQIRVSNRFRPSRLSTRRIFPIRLRRNRTTNGRPSLPRRHGKPYSLLGGHLHIADSLSLFRHSNYEQLDSIRPDGSALLYRP